MMVFHSSSGSSICQMDQTRLISADFQIFQWADAEYIAMSFSQMAKHRIFQVPWYGTLCAEMIIFIHFRAHLIPGIEFTEANHCVFCLALLHRTWAGHFRELKFPKKNPQSSPWFPSPKGRGHPLMGHLDR